MSLDILYNTIIQYAIIFYSFNTKKNKRSNKLLPAENSAFVNVQRDKIRTDFTISEKKKKIQHQSESKMHSTRRLEF